MIFTSVRGIIELVSEHDVGKTLASLQIVNPYTNTAFIDDDIKGEGTVRQMKEQGIEFRTYIDLGERRAKLGKTPTATQIMEGIVDPLVEELEKGKKYDVIIFDTWRIVYQNCRNHVERNQSAYSKIIKFQGNSTIIQGLISNVARQIEREYILRLREICDVLVLTHHVKDSYLNNVVVGKIPESSKTLQEVCNMRIWLRRNHVSKVPVMLFLKRPSMPNIKKTGTPEFINIVPFKITPTAKDKSIWEAIKRYEKDPFENRKPTADETPTVDEMAAIAGTLTLEQKQFAKEMLRLQAEAVDEFTASMRETVDEDKYPANGTQLLSMAANRFELDSEAVMELLEVKSLKDIFGLAGEKLAEAWETIKEASNE